MEEVVMVSRLMDLVVLVAEMSRESDKSLRDLDKELVHLGYSSEEIEHALYWMSSQWRPHNAVPNTGETPVFRVLSPWEAEGLSLDAHNYILRLYGLGLIDEDQLEQILGRVEPDDHGRLELGDIKMLAGDVMFNLGGDGIEDEVFHELDEDEAEGS
jgi:uncharacterized protein Smg (DUF494 family)